MHIRATIITVMALAMNAGAFAESPTRDIEAFSAVKQALQALVKQGATSEGSSISFLSRDATYVGDPKASAPFVETLPTLGGLMVKTRLPVTGQPERPQKDVAEITGHIKEACTSGGGMLERRDSPWGFEPTTTAIVARGMKALINAGLTGQMWCMTPNGTAMFMVEVVPASGATSPPFSLGWNWCIFQPFASTKTKVQQPFIPFLSDHLG